MEDRIQTKPKISEPWIDFAEWMIFFPHGFTSDSERVTVKESQGILRFFGWKTPGYWKVLQLLCRRRVGSLESGYSHVGHFGDLNG